MSVPERTKLSHLQRAGSKAKAFNSKVALGITASVGTMWCAYLFALIGIMGVAGALTNNIFLVLIVGAVSGYFLQLVLLPIIIVGQAVQGAKTEARDQETHDAVMAEHAELKELIADFHVTKKVR